MFDMEYVMSDIYLSALSLAGKHTTSCIAHGCDGYDDRTIVSYSYYISDNLHVLILINLHERRVITLSSSKL